MICSVCGSPVAVEGNFCPKCGAPVSAKPETAPGMGYVPPVAPHVPQAPQMPYVMPGMIPVPRTRVRRHLQTLSILWFAYAVYRALSGVAGMFFLSAVTARRFGGWAGGPSFPFGASWMGALLPFVIAATVVALALAILTGYSLMTRRSWGRTLAIIAAILALFKLPVGTALGIYTLWVLAPGVSGMEYDAIADRS